MKKVLMVLLVLSLVFSISFSSAFAGERQNEKANEKANKTVSEFKGNSSFQKTFKMELNAQKKEIAKAKGALEEQKLLLAAEYDALLAAGDTAGAEALLVTIGELDVQIAALQTDMKRLINERYMVIKTLYSEEELAQFENAAALIEQMYKDAYVLGMGSVVVKDNIIKFDAPPYIKGGRTIIPVRAITEELGAIVSYDPITQTVTVSKDGIDIVFTINSTKVFVDGVEQELDVSAEITNGRTYVPLRFIAETFGLTVTFDPDTEIIDIETPEEEPGIEDPEVEEPVTEEPETI
jgi:hypothetical protein